MTQHILSRRTQEDDPIALILQEEQDSWVQIEQSLRITAEFLLDQRIHAAQSKGVGPCA